MRWELCDPLPGPECVVQSATHNEVVCVAPGAARHLAAPTARLSMTVGDLGTDPIKVLREGLKSA